MQNVIRWQLQSHAWRTKTVFNYRFLTKMLWYLDETSWVHSRTSINPKTPQTLHEIGLKRSPVSRLCWSVLIFTNNSETLMYLDAFRFSIEFALPYVHVLLTNQLHPVALFLHNIYRRFLHFASSLSLLPASNSTMCPPEITSSCPESRRKSSASIPRSLRTIPGQLNPNKKKVGFENQDSWPLVCCFYEM